MILPVHLTGEDSEGTPYSLLVHTLDFSRLGARLGGIRQPLRVGETVTLEYKRRRAHFAIRWIGMPGTRSEQQVGVESLEPENFLWLDVPKQNYTDDVDAWSHRANNTKDPVPAATPAGTLAQNPPSTAEPVGTQESEPRVLGGEQAGRDSDTSNQDSVIIALEQRIAVANLPLGAALDLVAENAQLLLHGCGAAIALPENEEMVCRASAGRAPGIGVQFRAESGLTGDAVRSGRVVTCHNTLSDPRVDCEVWRKLNIRSAVSVPIPLSEGSTGVLEVFAAQPNAFTSAHGIMLEQMSALVHRLVATASPNLSGSSAPATR